MSQHLAKKVAERETRARWFYRGLIFSMLLLTGFLFFELRAICLPILVGAILAYLSRPIKSWFQIRWLPHEAYPGNRFRIYTTGP